VLSLDWDRPGRVTPAQRMRKTCPAASQEAWPEAESLAMKGSLGREPRWNADRCAPPRRGARPWPMPRQNTNCVCRRFASDSLPFFHSFVARMERSATREHDRSGAGYPGFRFASSGLHICEVGLREEQGRLHHLSLFALRSSLSALALNGTVAWQARALRPPHPDPLPNGEREMKGAPRERCRSSSRMQTGEGDHPKLRSSEGWWRGRLW